MNLRRLLAGECGQTNPITQLTSRVRQDLAHTERVGESTEGNPMPPQTFRMNDLFNEINVTVRPAMINQLPGPSCPAQFQQEMPPVVFPAAHIQGNFRYANQHRYCQEYSYQLRSMIQHEQIRNYQNQLFEERRVKYNESFDDEGKYTVRVSSSLDELEDLEEESAQNHLQEEKPESKPLLVYKNENSAKLEDKVDPKIFNDQINAYIRKFTAWGKKNTKIQETDLLTSGYPFTKNNPMLHHGSPTDQGLSYLKEGKLSDSLLCFEAAVQNDINNSEKWQLLLESLYRVEDTHKVLCATKEILQLKGDGDCWTHYSMANAYDLNNFPYQTCYSLVNWLKYHNDYSGVIPEDFKMEEMNRMQSTEVDDGTLQAVFKMFRMATQRNPSNLPDKYVQYGLGVICRLLGEYDKAVDCQRLVDSNVYDHKIGSRKFDLGMCLFFADKSDEAIKTFEEIANTKDNAVKVSAYLKIGFTQMYLKNYSNALIYFQKAHKLSSEDNRELVEAWLSCLDLLRKGQKLPLL